MQQEIELCNKFQDQHKDKKSNRCYNLNKKYLHKLIIILVLKNKNF